MLTIDITTLFCLPHVVFFFFFPHVVLKPLTEDFAESRVAHRHIDQ